jgi:hypothetical protein
MGDDAALDAHARVLVESDAVDAVVLGGELDKLDVPRRDVPTVGESARGPVLRHQPPDADERRLDVEAGSAASTAIEHGHLAGIRREGDPGRGVARASDGDPLGIRAAANEDVITRIGDGCRLPDGGERLSLAPGVAITAGGRDVVVGRAGE